LKDAPDSAPELRARALRLLARREHSRAELTRKLTAHAEDRTALEQLLDALAGKRQLSDERYAEERARQLARKYGAARVRLDLIAKGVAAETATRLSEACAADDLDRARAILSRKYRAPAASAQERARRMRFLQGRGFDGEIIRRLLSSRDAD
jgi:regulatory protein